MTKGVKLRCHRCNRDHDTTYTIEEVRELPARRACPECGNLCDTVISAGEVVALNGEAW